MKWCFKDYKIWKFSEPLDIIGVGRKSSNLATEREGRFFSNKILRGYAFLTCTSPGDTINDRSLYCDNVPSTSPATTLEGSNSTFSAMKSSVNMSVSRRSRILKSLRRYKLPAYLAMSFSLVRIRRPAATVHLHLVNIQSCSENISNLSLTNLNLTNWPVSRSLCGTSRF